MQFGIVVDHGPYNILRSGATEKKSHVGFDGHFKK
jgi:hypothetical protein